jgi:hypothetical protein
MSQKKKKSKSKKNRVKNKKGTQVIVKNIVTQGATEHKPSGFWSFLRKLASAFLP